MATEVPFHSGFLPEAEAEARTAICTKLSLEQLDQEPFFRARLWWLRARKFVADRIAGDEDIEDDMPRSKKGKNSYFAFVAILVLALYCGVSIGKHGLDNPLLSVRDGIFASLGLQDTPFGKLQPAQHAPISSISTFHVSPAPIIFPGSQPGWCHTVKLWSQKPSCGPFRGIWDSATPSRTFEHDNLAWAEGARTQKRTAPEVQALDAKVQSVVEMLHSALPQQDKVNALFYHLLGELKSELSSLRVHQAALGSATQHQAAPQPTQMPSHYLVIAACAVLVAASMIHSHRQNKALNATQGLILAQLAAASAQAEAAQRATEEVQRSQRRMERAADDARADTLQMHEALRDSLSSLEPRMGRLDEVDSSIAQLAGSMAAVSVEVLSWANEGRADLAKARRELDSAAAERESLLSELEEREAAADAQAARVQQLAGELQSAQAQAARLAASLEASALLQGQLQEALMSTEEELTEQEEAVKRTAGEALEREAKLAEAEGFCALLRSENEHLQQTAEELEAALEKTQQWVSEDEVLRGALEAELAEAQAAQADLQQRLAAAEEAARAASAEAERQRKAAVEKDKLLHYKKYELECMKKAVEQLQQETEGGLASMASSPLPLLS